MEQAQKVIEADEEIDQAETDIERLCLKLLLQQQPVAREGMRRIKMMSEEDQAAINDALERNDFTGEAYLKAVDNYNGQIL